MTASSEAGCTGTVQATRLSEAEVAAAKASLAQPTDNAILCRAIPRFLASPSETLR